ERPTTSGPRAPAPGRAAHARTGPGRRASKAPPSFGSRRVTESSLGPTRLPFEVSVTHAMFLALLMVWRPGLTASSKESRVRPPTESLLLERDPAYARRRRGFSPSQG